LDARERGADKEETMSKARTIKLGLAVISEQVVQV
jgi:hypothetical protein